MWSQILEAAGRHYYLTSSLMLIGIGAAFLAHLEHRRLRAREITLLAVVTSLCVILNEVCVHTLPLHAGTAMVVISGIALGPEAGILVGSLARFICNFFDGQGPWTAWEMVSWGLIGGISGVSFNKVVLKKRFPGEKETLAQRLSIKKEQQFHLVMMPVLCVLASLVLGYVTWLMGLRLPGEGFLGWRVYAFGVFGLVLGNLLKRKRLSADPYTSAIFTFFVVFLLYGGIMNFATMLLTAGVDKTAEISMPALRAYYVTGIPYDLEHAGAAAFTVFLIGDSMLQRLGRIQIKFGISL